MMIELMMVIVVVVPRVELVEYFVFQVLIVLNFVLVDLFHLVLERTFVVLFFQLLLVVVVVTFVFSLFYLPHRPDLPCRHKGRGNGKPFVPAL